ncbi:hypothetical protein BJ875DRAFT_498877 [Amylocarpus encephaloides]|uniref:RING-type domain-containing protein n=1 Tax=Amylocarpus encephaloides TaxID=45428 RepID=A0A9P7YBU0_9HELO|nr:hypothetical protein BJ875DRAFT_498877 [Amylocarpus encephaloides]
MASNVENGDGKCPICQEEFKNTTQLAPCDHRFCYTCVVDGWIQARQRAGDQVTCPMCRGLILEIHHSFTPDRKFEIEEIDTTNERSMDVEYDIEMTQEHTESANRVLLRALDERNLVLSREIERREAHMLDPQNAALTEQNPAVREQIADLARLNSDVAAILFVYESIHRNRYGRLGEPATESVTGNL